MNLVYHFQGKMIRVRVPHTVHATGQMVVSMKALSRSAYRAGRRMRRFVQCHSQSGPGQQVVASQRRRRGK